jgi:hypothetical protein
VDEEQEHLAVLWVRSCVAEDLPGAVGRHEQHSRRHMVRHELVPVPRCEHRLLRKFIQVRPACTHRGVETAPIACASSTVARRTSTSDDRYTGCMRSLLNYAAPTLIDDFEQAISS